MFYEVDYEEKSEVLRKLVKKGKCLITTHLSSFWSGGFFFGPILHE